MDKEPTNAELLTLITTTNVTVEALRSDIAEILDWIKNVRTIWHMFEWLGCKLQALGKLALAVLTIWGLYSAYHSGKPAQQLELFK
jgi:hypothetical protein